MKQNQILKCNQPLVGRRVCLHRLGPDHADLLSESFSNEGFWSVYRPNQIRTLTPQQLGQSLGNEFEHLPSQIGKIEWLVSKSIGQEKNDHLTPLGLAALSAFDAQLSKAEFMMGMFKSSQIRTGIGLEIALLVLDYAFNQEKLKKLESFVYSNNLQAQKSTIALGFRNGGRLKRYLRNNSSGETVDVWKNSMLENEFRNNSRLSNLSNRILGFDITLATAQNIQTTESAAPEIQNKDKFTLQASFSLK